MRKQHLTALSSATALIMFVAMPGAAVAKAAAPDAAAPAASDPDKGEITVTARRRTESIVDVPLAITVVSAAKMERLNITSTTELANFTPGLEFSSFTPGNSRNDRGGNRSIVFRGLYLSKNGGGVTQAGSMFLDGAAVIGNEIPAGLDIGAVEVLRGPQSVYFGRASMTGAIAYRTKAIPKTLAIDTNIELAQRNTFRFETSIAGPLLPDLLGFRVTGLYEKNNGFITNAYNPTGPKLGGQQRRSLSGTLDFTPSSNLEMKVYGNYFEDEDNPSATVNIFPDASYSGTPAAQGSLLSLGVIDNCAPGGNRAIICGAAPAVSNAIAYSRTDIPAQQATALFDTTPFIAAEHFKHQAGLQRHVFNSHAVINFEISDYLKAQSITGYHVDTVVQAVDGAAQAVTPTSAVSVLFFGLDNKATDFSQELRLSSDPKRVFSWTIGANYVSARNLSNAVNSTTSNTPAQTFSPGVFNITDDRGTTFGFFLGGYLKALDNKLTFSAEGRYQIDDRFAQTLAATTMNVITTSPILDKKFHAFYPRVSADYDVGGSKKIYVSLSQGGRPGGFNGGLLSFFDPTNPIYTVSGNNYATTTAQITSALGVTNPSFKQESLRIGEVGFKGYLAGGKGYFDVNTYFGILNNQQVTEAALIQIVPIQTTVSAVTNTGKTQVYGVEFTGDYNFTPEISLDTTFSWNHTKRLAYIDNTGGTLATYGFGNFRGLALPFAPLVTASAVLSYEEHTSDHWSPFANAAYVFRGKQYADIANLSYIPGRATLDLRVGAKDNRFRIEAFVTNLFDNKTYPAGNVAPDFGINQVNSIRSSYSGFFGAYALPRTFGLRVSAAL